MRTITDEHLQAYQEGGCLQKLFDVIKEDPELSFEIRMNNKVMIYYHKDRILTISYCKGKPSIDTLSEKYYKNAMPPSVSFEDGDLIQTLRDKSQLRQYFIEAKQLVGSYKAGVEFEVQQNIALDNRSFSNRFVVVDMEWQLPQSDIKKEERISRTRIDLVVVDMKRNERGENDVYLGELKVGMDATDGKSGIDAHIEKTNKLICSSKACAVLRADVERIIRQKVALGLLEGDYAGLNLSATPRMMLILAHRGSEERQALEKQVEKEQDKAKASGMAMPLIVWHNVQIILDV
jgi:hypothetical protein